jgi:hypothetical protein
VLFQRGDILTFRASTHGQNSDLFIYTYTDIETTLRGKRPDLHYMLTAQGGACWEGVTHADWQRFTSVDQMHIRERHEVVIVAGSRPILEELMRLFPLTHLDHEMLDETMIWDELQPWPATY